VAIDRVRGAISNIGRQRATETDQNGYSDNRDYMNEESWQEERGSQYHNV
jgi:hypothetical protein